MNRVDCMRLTKTGSATKRAARSGCTALLCVIISGFAWRDARSAAPSADSYSSLSLDALARNMKEAVSFPAFRLHAQVYLHAAKAEQPVLSEEVAITVSGPCSRVERDSFSTGEANGPQCEKTTVSVFDGRTYRKLTTFQDGKTPLAWEGPANGNAQEIGNLLFAGLALKQVNDFELNPSHYFEVYNENTELFEVHPIDPPLSVVYMDPRHGFLIKRTEHYSAGGDPLRICEVTFRTSAGRWFPAEQHIDSYYDGALRPDSIVKIASPEPDPAVEAALFQIAFPPEARVMPATLSLAEIDRMRAETGLEGIEKEVATASKGPETTQAPAPPPEPARRRGPWTFGNAVMIIALGIIVGLFRRARRR